MYRSNYSCFRDYTYVDYCNAMLYLLYGLSKVLTLRDGPLENLWGGGGGGAKDKKKKTPTEK